MACTVVSRTSPLALALACLGGCAPSRPIAPGCPEQARGSTDGHPEQAGRSTDWRLDETAFLPLLEDRALRERLWVMYTAAEPHAVRFAGGVERWFPVRLLIASDRALWWEHGLIEIPVAPDDTGVIAHELFHGSFHGSPLNAGRDAAWGEGFADAFRYLLELEVLGEGGSPWMRNMDELAQLSDDALLARRRDDETFRVYSYPALVILARVDRDIGRFEALWFDLLERRRATGQDILAEEFGELLARPEG